MRTPPSLALLTVRVQTAYGWSSEFSNAYAVLRWHEGNSHAVAYRLAMSSPYIRRKPSNVTMLAEEGVKP